MVTPSSRDPRDNIPVLMRAGEVVRTPEEMKAERGMVVNLTFNVAAGAKFDRDAVQAAMPQIISALNRESRNGTIVVRKNGVA
jgi:hypothetical protein